MENDEVFISNFISKYSTCKSQCFILNPESSLQALEKILKPDSHVETILAFDFDQTLKVLVPGENPGMKKLQVRGAQSSIDSLFKLKQSVKAFCIITASVPTKENIKTLAKEVQELGLESLFDVEKFDPTKAFKFIESWGPNENLSHQRLEDKMIYLFILLTDRRAMDLPRVGYSTTRFVKEKGIYYRLEKNKVWSAELLLKENLENPLLCLVNCWQHFEERTKEKRLRDENTPDRLFLNFQDGTFQTLTENEFETRAMDLMKQSGYTQKQAERFLHDPAQELTFEGVKLATMGNLLAARYNKAEAVEYFIQQRLKQEKSGPIHLIFVDDNSDNAFNVFTHFSSKEESNQVFVSSIWYPPPKGGKEETHNLLHQTIFKRIAKQIE